MPHSYGEIAEQLRRSTVRIESGAGTGGGSGVVWSGEGTIVTNAHVARTAEALVELWDGRRLPSRVQARDPRRDLAILRVAASGLPAARFGDSDLVRPGELVVAVGNPLGFTGAVSTGAVHSAGPVRGMGPLPWIRAGVRLAPGNSGGPLANAEGRVIGINTAVLNGLGLAVPSNAVAALVRRGARPLLGVAVQPVRGGLLVLQVSEGSPAALASLWVGDLLTAIGGKPLRDPDALAQALDRAGGVVVLDFLRGDRARTRHATLRLEARAAEAA